MVYWFISAKTSQKAMSAGI